LDMPQQCSPMAAEDGSDDGGVCLARNPSPQHAMLGLESDGPLQAEIMEEELPMNAERESGISKDEKIRKDWMPKEGKKRTSGMLTGGLNVELGGPMSGQNTT
jgi:hypothetical protein